MVAVAHGVEAWRGGGAEQRRRWLATAEAAADLAMGGGARRERGRRGRRIYRRRGLGCVEEGARRGGAKVAGSATAAADGVPERDFRSGKERGGTLGWALAWQELGRPSWGEEFF